MLQTTHTHNTRIHTHTQIESDLPLAELEGVDLVESIEWRQAQRRHCNLHQLEHVSLSLLLLHNDTDNIQLLTVSTYFPAISHTMHEVSVLRLIFKELSLVSSSICTMHPGSFYRLVRLM